MVLAFVVQTVPVGLVLAVQLHNGKCIMRRGEILSVKRLLIEERDRSTEITAVSGGLLASGAGVCVVGGRGLCHRCWGLRLPPPSVMVGQALSTASFGLIKLCQPMEPDHHLEKHEAKDEKSMSLFLLPLHEEKEPTECKRTQHRTRKQKL